MSLIVITRPAPIAPPRPLTLSPWYSPIPGNAALHPNTAAIVTEIVRQSGLALPIINGSQDSPVWSSEVTIVPIDQPVIPGLCSHDSIMSAIAATGIPIPPDVYVPPSPDTDKAVIIYQPDAPNGGFLWSLQGFRWITPGAQWACNSLDRMSRANTNTNAHFVDWVGGPGGSTPAALYSTYEAQVWGIQGSGLPYAPGMLTAYDIQREYVDHALLLEVYDAASGGHVWPAIARSDGGAVAPNPAAALSEGMWLAQDPGIVIDSGWPLADRLYMQGARDFGLVITDRTLFGLAVRASCDAHAMIDDAHLTHFTWNTLRCLAVGSDAVWHPTS